MGRKGRYETQVQPKLGQIQEWYGLLTEEQIAKRLGVSVRSFERYKTQHEELRQALLNGKQALIEDLKATLKKKAKGFHYKETKKTIRNVNGQSTQVTEEYERYSPPDTGAIHLLLKNLDDTWRNDDKTTVDLKREKLELDRARQENESW